MIINVKQIALLSKAQQNSLSFEKKRQSAKLHARVGVTSKDGGSDLLIVAGLRSSGRISGI